MKGGSFISKILIINNGSTSFRFKVLELDDYCIIATGAIERLFMDDCYLKYITNSTNIREKVKISDYNEAVDVMKNLLFDNDIGVIKNKNEIISVGYRIVHGGEKFNQSVVIDNTVLNEIRNLCHLMPLHGRSIVNSIEACSKIFDKSLPVAVFDTAFHSSIPKENYLYAIPYEYYIKYGIRKYGFHGISYSYVLDRFLNITNKKRNEFDGVICHLGGGSSICSIKEGKSYDTTMEFTPSTGLIMASRIGNIDPMALFYIMQQEGKSIDDIINMINNECGYKALCNDTDMKSIVDRSEKSDDEAILTRKIIELDFKKNLFSMISNLDKVDSIIFTGGIGSKNKEQRKMLLQNLSHYGIKIDKELNDKCFNQEMEISSKDSNIPIYVIPDDEEKEIACECVKILKRRL